MYTSTKIGLGTIIGIALASMLILLAILSGKSEVAVGSVDGQGYNSTTTASTVASTFTAPVTLTPTTTSVSGIFGSVIITKQTGPTTLNIYDATTTNVNLRTGNVATSSILLASFSTSTPAGTYTFDTVFKTGLIVDPTPLNAVGAASSTITWRY